MAVVSSSSTGQNNATGREKQAVEAGEASGGNAFEMISLMNHLPHKRKGLSTYFSGKSRSFKCMADAKCVDDLKKEEVPEAKRRKYTDRRSDQVLPLFFHRGPTTASSSCGSTGAVAR
ncbi:hypothetical protein Taro_029321 [Colocasia esculenta]|uniref:Uncharacterized protein n=1 Tax=Colocasia esculenta TaxID=4460 RepID=A0A843VZX7_COLES|nr:hypothetical protein [Colocasia esculenta]